MTRGAAQGSLFGPDCWNLSYNDIFNVELPGEAHLVGYADDTAAILFVRIMNERQRRITLIAKRLKTWLATHALELAEHKTEVVFLTK